MSEVKLEIAGPAGMADGQVLTLEAMKQFCALGWAQDVGLQKVGTAAG